MRKLIVALNNRNEKTAHLYAKTQEDEKHLDFDYLKKTLHDARMFGFDSLCLSGVNPLEYGNIEKLLEKSSELGYFIEVECGPFDFKPYIDMLNKHNINKVVFTLAGTKDEVNDQIFGRDSFELTLNNIKIARENNFSVRVKYLISKLNSRISCADLQFLGRVSIEDAWPIGKIQENRLFVNSNDVLEYWPLVKKNISKILSADSNFCEDRYPNFIQGKEVYIDWNGDIKPFPYSEMESCGNIFREGFGDILKKLETKLNELIIESVRDGSFLNWKYYYEKYARSLTEFKNEIDWTIINNIILPTDFSILMTQKCNFACDFCEFSCNETKDKNMDIADFEKLLREGKRIGMIRVIFDGGEPLVHPNIIEALEICHKYGYEVLVLTNGWKFEELLPYFQKYNVREFIFGINGATTETNDRIMGKSGAFERQVKAIKKSVEMGFFTGLHIVLHPLNIDELDNFFQLARDWRVNYLMASKITEVGRGERAEFRLNESQIGKVRETYKKYADFLNKIRFFASFLDSKRYLNCKFLNRNSQMSVHWGGEIALCSMLPLLNFPFKKIHDHSLMQCLSYMNEISCRFQNLRNKEYPTWKLSENPYYICEYCHHAIKNDIRSSI